MLYYRIIHYSIANPLDSEPPARLRHIYLHDFNIIYYYARHYNNILLCMSKYKSSVYGHADRVHLLFYRNSTCVQRRRAQNGGSGVMCVCVCVKTIGEKTDVCVVNWVVIRSIRSLYSYIVYTYSYDIILYGCEFLAYTHPHAQLAHGRI